MLDAARDLYGLAPGEFTAARNALAKQLKAAGSTDEAKTIGGLRRPKAAEFALNRLARTDVDVISRFAAAVTGAQKAQAAAIGGDAAALRNATAELRQANSAVVDAAVGALAADGGNGEAQRDEIVGLLREFISGADAGPLVAGIVGSEALVGPDEFFPGAPDPPPSSAKKATPAKAPSLRLAAVEEPAPKVVREPSASAKATAAAKQAMQRAERTRLAEALRSAERAVAKASTALDDAQNELIARRAGLKAAKAVAEAATRDLDAYDPG